MFVHKQAPGKYVVWVADVSLTFKTERDAIRFAQAGNRAIRKSWEASNVG